MSLVIIPTYNEREGIEAIIRAVFELNCGLEVLIVDDNSPDGTAAIVKGLQESRTGLHKLEPSGKLGLGTAYVGGFKYARERGYDAVFEMDADFSHDPKVLPKFLERIKDHDFVLGSRYVNGISVVNWPLSRLMLSYFASYYTRVITGMPIKDPTGGFKCFRTSTLKAIDLDRIHSNGYSFQIEMNFKAWKKGFKYIEIPIIFEDRRVGKSKMSKAIVREAVWMVWKLRINSIFGRL